jgi:hypothetical protein
MEASFHLFHGPRPPGRKVDDCSFGLFRREKRLLRFHTFEWIGLVVDVRLEKDKDEKHTLTIHSRYYCLVGLAHAGTDSSNVVDRATLVGSDNTITAIEPLSDDWSPRRANDPFPISTLSIPWDTATVTIAGTRFIIVTAIKVPVATFDGHLVKSSSSSSSLIDTLRIVVDDAVFHGKCRNSPPITYGILGPHCCRIHSSGKQGLLFLEERVRETNEKVLLLACLKQTICGW